MTSSVLGKDGGIDICVGYDRGGERAPRVIGSEEKRLEYALGKAMAERKEEESEGDIVECYPQVLQECKNEAPGGKIGVVITHSRLDHKP